MKQLLKQNKSVSIHKKNVQILAIEIFKTKDGLNPVITEDIFKFENLTYNFRNAETLTRNNTDSVKYELLLYLPKFGKFCLMSTKR